MPSPFSSDPNSMREQQEGLMKSTTSDSTGSINPSTTGMAPETSKAAAIRVQRPSSAGPGPVPSSGFSPPKNVSRRGNLGGKPVVLTANPNVILIGKPKVEETESCIKVVRIVNNELYC